jgi:hypothetical protein
MFVVNKGRNFGFLRCSCGFAEMLRNPAAHVVEIQARGHRSPYNQPCTLKSWHTEDLAHEFHTDVLQIRIDQPIPLPANLRPEEIDGWRDGFVRTLVEAVRLGAVSLLGIDQRELCGTARSRIFGYPEVVLYDSVAGGAGYCQMLTARFAMRDLLKNALEVLRCKAECSHSCRTCLQGYENQIHWDKLNRKPVLAWLERALNINQAKNHFDRCKAVPLNVANGSAILQAELESANHLLVVAPRLFNLQKDATNENHFGTPETVAFAKKLVSWMTAGNTLEIALPEPPLIHADFPNSIWVAERLKTCMEDGSLKLCRLPASFDPRQWPRAVINPDKNGGRAFFSTSLLTDGFLDAPLPTPLWKGPSPDAAALQAMRVGWVALDSKALRIPKDTTLLEYSAGQSRDHTRDFSFCKSKSFAVVRIEDPFILKTEWNYKQLKRFLEIFFPLMTACPKKVELRTRTGEEPDQKLMLHDLGKWLKEKGASFSFQLVPVFGIGKKDFHDRRLVFQPDESNTKKRITILMTGGVDRYLDSKFECSIVIQRS